MSYLISGACGTVGVHTATECLPHEKGVIRAIAFIDKDTVVADYSDPTEWATNVASGAAKVVKFLSGSYDGGSAKFDKGYGAVATIYVNSTHKLSINDPNFLNNETFWNEIQKSSAYKVVFVTDTLVHVGTKPCTIFAKKPVADDFESDVIGMVEVEWKQRDLVLAHPKPSGTFEV
jgi:hypothetical protein